MKINKIIIILALFLSFSCDYQPIYSEKNIGKSNNFTISSIVFSGHHNINQKLKNNLKNYINFESKKIKYDLVIHSTFERKISSKNKKGNPDRYVATITFNIDIFENNKLKNKKKFEKSYEYKNKENKYNLKIYEQNVKNNLIDELGEDIINYLNTIK